MKTMKKRSAGNARILTGVYNRLEEAKRHYVLNLVNGKKEELYCTSEALRIRLHDASKAAVHYVSY